MCLIDLAVTLTMSKLIAVPSIDGNEMLAFANISVSIRNGIVRLSLTVSFQIYRFMENPKDGHCFSRCLLNLCEFYPSI
jgi:hypothetical protein